MMEIMPLSLGGPTQTMEAGGKSYLFERHPRFGPIVVNKDDSEARHPGSRSPFWRAEELWDKQGRQFNDDGTCKWVEPPKKPLYHLGGKHYTESKSLAAEHGVTEPIERGKP